MKIPALALVALLTAAPAWAGGDQFGGFEQFADAGSLKPFAKDLGGLLGSGTFHSGRILGYTGFDIGARGVVQFTPSKNNRIFRDKGVKNIVLPWVHVEIGMPLDFSGFVRGINYQGLTVAGGGLSYGIIKGSDKPWTPHLMVTAVANAAVHQHFSATHFGGTAVFSMGVPKFTPFIGGGVDRTKLVVRSSQADVTLNGKNVTALGPRGTAGVRFKPWTFIYINAAYVWLHGQSGAEAGLGLRF